MQPVVVGLATHKRQILVTSVLEAQPESRHTHPGPTIYPFLAAVATAITFYALIFTPWALVFGIVIFLPPMLGWGFPRRHKPPEKEVVG